MNRTCLAVLLTLTTLHASSAAETLTAINMDPDWEGINGWAIYIGDTYPTAGIVNGAAAQEFKASVSGPLTTLEASVDKFSGGAPLVISFYESDNGLPGQILGSVSIPESMIGTWNSLPNPPVQAFDVSAANVTVVARQNYIVTLTTPLAGAVRYRAILTAPNVNSFGYRTIRSDDGGQTWRPSNITPEIGMRLYVDDSVPAPPPAETLAAINMDPDWEVINGWSDYIGYTHLDYDIFNGAAAQEFPVSFSGALTTLEASITKTVGGAPLVITIYESDNGLPGKALGSVEIPESQISTWNDLSNPPVQPFDLSSTNAYLEAGRNYIVAFTTPLAGAPRYSARLTAPNANSFGNRALHSDDGGLTWEPSTVSPEIGMRLYVDGSVPPPLVEYEAGIDIQPGDPENVIQLGKKKPKPVEVVLFGDGRFAVNDMLVETLALGDPTIDGGLPTPPADSFIVDVDGDGIDDLSLVFDLGEMEFNGSIDPASVALVLDGMLSTGDFVSGADLVTISQPGNKGNGNGKGKNSR